MEELTTVPHHDDIASSSMASASIPYVHYDVYIDFCDYNHCGRDAHTFATKLYRLLHSHQLQVFLDVPNLLFKGKIPADVEQAILAASAHITIFPPNYAQSQWCLDKLVLMTKSSAQSRTTILPVFYYAKPAELRRTGEGSKGAYAEALRYYEKNNQYNSQTVQDWRGALSYVTNISGFVVNEDRAEEEILGEIVQTILNGFPYGPRYDVFLSHRGPDAKKTLASALYRRLTSHGLRVFLDELEFVRGFRIIQQIEIAIQFAHVNIAILSPTYADSTWCMEELNLMVTSRATILPVFYRVTHSDLRYGVYVEALLNHRKKQRYDSMTLQNWGDTLSKVAELPDYYYYELDWNEEEQLDNIVKAVLKSVAKRSEHLRTCDVQNVVKSVLKDDAKVEISSEVQSSVVKSVLKDDAKVEISSEVQSSVFTAGQEIATSLVSCGLLPKAWEASCLANESESEAYRLNEYEGVAYVAFPSFHNIERFDVKGSKYGEGYIQTDNIFSDGLKGNDDQPALVHQGALKQFLHIMMNTDFKAKLQNYTDWKAKKLKPIIFVGHSLGGAVATLATLWVLEKRLRKSCPFCITFGCPLVGDERLVQAVGRENWAGNFCHLISKNDIVPRMLLAPFELIANSLTDIFLYWKGILPYSFIQNDCKTLLENVLKYTSMIANYGTTDKGSPYRPFGTYMFCSSRGAVCIENSEAVLKMLHWTLESQEKSSNNDALACISEHTNYGLILDHVRQNSINERRIENCDSQSSYNMGISLQLEAIGLGAQNYHAKIALEIAGKN